LSPRFASLFAYAPGRNVISPATDMICVGLGSIIFLAPLVIFGDGSILAPGMALIATLTICVNMPHFLASYRILYRSKESIVSHKWASIIVPGLLVIYLTFAVQRSETDIRFLGLANFVSGLYLAWHYTGQAWGMMATYGFLAGAPFSDRERTLIRTGLRIQLVWHLSWVLQYGSDGRPSDHPGVNQIYFVMSCITVVAFLLALTGFYLYRKRTGKFPPLRALVAWLAICFWYGAMARDPAALFWVQVAHAVQYLSFPSRVEINNYDKKHPEQAHNPRSHFLVFSVYFIALIGAGYVIKYCSEVIGVVMVGDLFGHISGTKFPIAVLAFINIHHYFTDGVIWKISNKEVKQELFAHLKR
jgi:hypothetical protein